MPAAAVEQAGPADGGQEQQPGFLSRIGTVLFKIMMFQTVMNFAASYFSPKPQPNMQQLPPLRNVLAPNAEFDLFMHVHYLPSPVAEDQSDAASAGEAPELGLLDLYKAKLGALPASSPLGKPLRMWGRTSLKKLMNPSARGEIYCPRSAATDGASLLTADEGGADVARSVSETAAKPGETQCLSPRYLPKPIETWQLLGQKYTYDWWSKSATKELQLTLDSEFLRNEDLMLVLTVTVVPHTAYDRNRHEMSPDAVLTAAAELPEERLIQRSQSLVQHMKPFKGEETEHSLLFGGEQEQKEKEEEDKAEPIRHLKTHFDVSLVYDTSTHTAASLAAGPLQGLQLRLASREYEPMIDISDFWLLEKHFVPLNDTLAGEPQTLSLSFGVGSVHAWLVQSQMTGVQQQQTQLGLQSDREASIDSFLYQNCISFLNAKKEKME